MVYEYSLVEHTDAVHEHTDAVHDAAVDASSCHRMSYTSAAETQTEGLLRCAEAIELDTDVVAGKLPVRCSSCVCVNSARPHTSVA